MWMQRTAVIWVVYTLTESTFMIGLTMFAEQFPAFIFSLYGGIVADRHSRYKIILITQSLMMIQAILLAALVLSGHYHVWQILTLSIILGVINAFDVPARQPLVHEMVNDEADVPNAIAFNSSLTNFARLAGPALAGIILEAVGAGICFLINAASFIAVLACLLLMQLPKFIPPQTRTRMRTDLKEGFTYLKNTPALGSVILFLLLVSFFVLPFNTLIPVFAKVIFSGGAATYGYISGFIGLGALTGAFILAALKPKINLRRVLLISTIVFGVGLAIFSQIGYFPLAMFFAFIAGLGMMAQTTICFTIVQIDSAKAMRGRVMSYAAMAYFGMLPLGSLVIGAVSEKIGAPTTILIEGILALLIAALFYNAVRRKRSRAREEQNVEKTEKQIQTEILEQM